MTRLMQIGASSLHRSWLNIPPMNNSGINAATSDRLIDTTVKLISLEPLIAASRMLSPASR